MLFRSVTRQGFMALALVLGSLGGEALVAPAVAQEGVILRNLIGRLGLLPEEKEPIEYRERPALVVPKNLDSLRAPEPTEGHTKNAQWPKDPDVAARDKERARKNLPVFFPSRNDPTEGGRLSVSDMAAGRAAPGTRIGEAPVSANDKTGVRLSIEEMQQQHQASIAPSYPPGTEPPRRYLTDPPVGLRMPAGTAPAGKLGGDRPVVDNFRPDGAWKRID